MDRIVEELAVTLLPASEGATNDEYGMMCKCGTNCTVCTGTGSRPCNKIVADSDLETLRNALAGA